MKKIISILVASVMLIAVFAFVGCEKAEAKLKLGVGTVVSTKTSDATEDTNGQGQATVTIAAVLVDDEGKIVKAFIDCADSTVGHTVDGKAIASKSFATKYELGDNYGMKSPYGSSKEWYEHVDAFCTLIVGKTAKEVKALVAADYKGTEEVINAGCTIYVAEFAAAVEKAINSATASEATASDTLKLGVYTAQTATDATEDKDGSNKVETTVYAAAVGANGKVTAAMSDTVEVTFTFDTNGKSTFDPSKATLTSKREQGDSYGMKSPYGSEREWYEHANAFDAATVGKTATEIAALMGNDGKGTADVQAAGCTIYVSAFVKAAEKIK